MKRGQGNFAATLQSFVRICRTLQGVLDYFGLVQRRHCDRGLANSPAQNGLEIDLAFGVVSGEFLRTQANVLNRLLLSGAGRDSGDVHVLLVAGNLNALNDRVADLRRKQPDGAQRVVVAGDHIVNHRRIAVRVDHRDHRDAQLAGFGDRDRLVVRVDDEERVGKTLHVLDASQVGLQVLALPLQLDDFFLGQQFVAAVGGHLIQFLKALHRLLHSDPVRQEPTQPAVVDIEHAAAIGFLGDGVLRLPLGADKKDDLALRSEVSDPLARFLEHLQGFLQVDDVNAVALAEDVFLHAGVPALRLMPEVDSRFEQLLHSDVSQTASLLDCIPASAGIHPLAGRFNYENAGAPRLVSKGG